MTRAFLALGIFIIIHFSLAQNNPASETNAIGWWDVFMNYKIGDKRPHFG